MNPVGRPRKYTPEEAERVREERTREFLRENQEYRLLHCSKQRAKKAKIEHTIIEEDIIIPILCPLLRIPLTNTTGKGRVYSNASIDRIDNTKGYTKDNIQIISDLANRMKQNATKEQLITFSKSILNLYSN